MANKIYTKSKLSDGTEHSLDNIDGDDLAVDDRGMVTDTTEDAVFHYILDASGDTAYDYGVIAPTDNPGNKRWKLQYPIGTVRDIREFANDLSVAVTQIGSTETVLLINKAITIASGTTVTVPDTLTLWTPPGGSIDGVAGGSTETLNLSKVIRFNNANAFGSNLTVTGLVQTLVDNGAVSIVTAITKLQTNGIAAITLADSYEGASKFIYMDVHVGNSVLTPVNLLAGTTITFSAVGQTARLIFTGGTWIFESGTATLA